MTETFLQEPSEGASPVFWGGSQAGAAGAEEVSEAVLEYKLVLMNKQDEVALGLAHVPHRQYSQGLKITTVGEWWGRCGGRAGPGAGGLGCGPAWEEAAAAAGAAG